MALSFRSNEMGWFYALSAYLDFVVVTIVASGRRMDQGKGTVWPTCRANPERNSLALIRCAQRQAFAAGSKL